MLRFFFDGVPEPGNEARATTGEGGGRKRAAGPQVVRHKPVVEGRCEVCHGTKRSDFRSRGFVATEAMNLDKAWEACRTCHSDPKEVGEPALVLREGAWLHGPVAAGRCRECHNGHSSRYPHLLRAERLEEICLACHDGLEVRGGEMASLDCVVCHDPHVARGDSRVFLRGGRAGNCAECHALDKENRPWLHGPVAAGECGACHDAHGRPGSERHVRRPLRDVCLSCHEETSLSQPTHRPGSGGECDTCHEPHAARQASDFFLRDRIAETVPGESAFLKREETEKTDEVAGEAIEASVPEAGKAKLAKPGAGSPGPSADSTDEPSPDASRRPSEEG